MMDKNFDIRISSGTIVRAILLILLFVFLYLIRDIVLVVLAAIVIASAVEPITSWFAKYKVKRLPATIIVYLFIALLLAGFFVFFLPSLLNEAVVYLDNLPKDIHLSDFWSPIRDTGLFTGNTAIDSLSTHSFSVKELIDGIKSLVSGGSSGVLKTASIVFGGMLSFVLMIVLSFYLAVQEDGIGGFLRIISPVRHHNYIIDLWKRSQRKIGYWMQGQMLLGVIVGVLVYLGLMILGVEHALLLASIAAVFEIIPIFGPILAAIPAVIISGLNGGVTGGLLVVGLYLIIHQFENHLLYPLVVKKIVGVSPILVILALVIGVELAGFLGAILAVPVAAAIMEFVNDVEQDKRKIHAHNGGGTVS